MYWINISISCDWFWINIFVLKFRRWLFPLHGSKLLMQFMHFVGNQCILINNGIYYGMIIIDDGDNNFTHGSLTSIFLGRVLATNNVGYKIFPHTKFTMSTAHSILGLWWIGKSNQWLTLYNDIQYLRNNQHIYNC